MVESSLEQYAPKATKNWADGSELAAECHDLSTSVQQYGKSVGRGQGNSDGNVVRNVFTIFYIQEVPYCDILDILFIFIDVFTFQ